MQPTDPHSGFGGWRILWNGLGGLSFGELTSDNDSVPNWLNTAFSGGGGGKFDGEGGRSVFLIAVTKLGQALAQTGAIAGGCTAWGVVFGLIGGAFAVDAGFKVDRWELATKGGTMGALFGVAFAVSELVS